MSITLTLVNENTNKNQILSFLCAFTFPQLPLLPSIFYIPLFYFFFLLFVNNLLFDSKEKVRYFSSRCCYCCCCCYCVCSFFLRVRKVIFLAVRPFTTLVIVFSQPNGFYSLFGTKTINNKSFLFRVVGFFSVSKKSIRPSDD